MRKNKEEIKEFNKKILAVCDFLIENGYERSYHQMTQKTDVNINYIRDLKNGKSCYSEKFLEKLCSVYGVNKTFILTGEGKMLKQSVDNRWNNNISITQRDNNTNNINQEREALITHLRDEVEYLREQNKKLMDLLTNKK